MLRSLPGKEEVDGCGVVRVETGLHTLTVSLRERLNCVRNIAHYNGTPVREFATASLQSPRDVSEAQVGVGFQVSNEIVGRLFNRLLRAGGQYEHLCRARRVTGGLRRRLFKNDVCICAADTKRADARPPWGILWLPFC